MADLGDFKRWINNSTFTGVDDFQVEIELFETGDCSSPPISTCKACERIWKDSTTVDAMKAINWCSIAQGNMEIVS